MKKDLLPDATWRIDYFLRTMASPAPAPGGGAAAAFGGALGTALLLKVIHILLRRRTTLPAVRSLWGGKVPPLQLSMKKLQQLIYQDAYAYSQWVEASRTGRGKSAARRLAIQSPREICREIQKVSQATRDLARAGGSSLGADVKAAHVFLDAGFSAARKMVEINCR